MISVVRPVRDGTENECSEIKPAVWLVGLFTGTRQPLELSWGQCNNLKTKPWQYFACQDQRSGGGYEQNR